MQDHRRLRVWRQAVALAVNVRRATSHYPPRGYAELKEQTISAAESIVNTIVEGCGASTQREFARFLGMSIKSNKELEGELELAAVYGILARNDWRSLSAQTVDVRRMTFGLRREVLRLDQPPETISDSAPDATQGPSRLIRHPKRETHGAERPPRRQADVDPPPNADPPDD